MELFIYLFLFRAFHSGREGTQALSARESLPLAPPPSPPLKRIGGGRWLFLVSHSNVTCLRGQRSICLRCTSTYLALLSLLCVARRSLQHTRNPGYKRQNMSIAADSRLRSATVKAASSKQNSVQQWYFSYGMTVRMECIWLEQRGRPPTAHPILL